MKSKTLERFSDKVLQIVRANGIGVFSLSAADNRLYPQAMKNGSLPVELDLSLIHIYHHRGLGFLDGHLMAFD